MEHTNGDTRRHGMTVARGGIVVAKRLDVESLPLPAISYELRSERERRTEVRLVEQLPATVGSDRVGYHPEYGGDGWSCYDGGELVWRGELDPGESRRVVLAIWLDAPDTALSLLTPPTVESVRAVANDTEPRVLDETLLTGTGHAAETAAVAEHVPDEALHADDVAVPTLAELPNPGDGLDAPPRAVVDEAADAIAGGGSEEAHDRYYHLRLSVESAYRGGRDVSVLEDLTNALSVLYADADDRDGGAWRVLDVAIGTNWQAERIVTALGDDHRVSGLVVTELTGAVAARTHRSAMPSADPNPDEFAASVFESASPTNDGAAPEAADASTDRPSVRGHDDPTSAAETTATANGAFGLDDEDADDAFGLDDEGTDGTFGVGSSFDPTEGFESTGDFEFGAAVDDGMETTPDETADEDTADDPFQIETRPGGRTDEDASAGDQDAGPADEPTDAMATFAELKQETEQADVADLDAELEGVVLSPTGSEEYTIGKLLDDVEEDTGLSSV
ncbi:hypothetical protein [Haloarchaeobius litoreus]|uniref:Uncharacterized protein n=1 Tax=Haloarchaeobius litoreus TaxID=755306 RepID=A0ABD6DLM5_9EURY|nr:hypothetical protein [Haloarchaeobius litoreus]